MKRAALLDSHVYEEVEADTTATGQAAAVVAIVAVAQGVGAASLGPSGIIAGTIAALVAWLVWAGVTYCGNRPAQPAIRLRRAHDLRAAPAR